MWGIKNKKKGHSENPNSTCQEVLGIEISLAIQLLRPRAPSAGVLGLIPDQRTSSHVTRLCMLQRKILHVASKIQHSQINKNKYFLKRSFRDRNSLRNVFSL